MLTDIFFVLWLILAIGAVAGIVFIIWVLRYIRLNHHQTWIEVGSPSFIWNNSIRNNFLFLKFIFDKKPRQKTGTDLFSGVIRQHLRFATL